MAQIMNMHTQTRTGDQFLLASTKHNASLSILKKNLMGTSYRSKRSHTHISCSVGLNTTPITQTETEKLDPATIDIRRSQFPPKFMFGAGSSAYQVEGAWIEGGKGPSIWDTFAHQHPNKIKGGSNGDVALDMYHRYKDDIQLMKEMGLDSYRFSISWPRILPNGTLQGGINKEGIMYYNNLINELIKNGITPFVTLFHWDVPQALENKYHGFLCKDQILNDFKDYCQICFQEFGDRVKHWTTLNEPYVFSCFGYSTGRTAPGRCSGNECPAGDSLTEPYTVSHNLLLAHATAVQLYRNHYKSIQGGEIGIVLNCTGYKPYSGSLKDKDAKHRALEFMLGWYMEPLVNGEYPYIMRELVDDRLPEFEKEESDMVKGSFDFIGLNYYTSKYAKNVPKTFPPTKSVDDSRVEETVKNIDDVEIGPQEGAWIYRVPDGLPNLLTYIKNKYDVPKLYVTENGTMQLDNNDHNKLPLESAISDQSRVDYMILHLKELRDAIDCEELKVEGFFVWSLMDSYEWMSGYTNLFGLHYIDRKNNLARIPKKSADWYTKFLHS